MKKLAHDKSELTRTASYKSKEEQKQEQKNEEEFWDKLM